MHWRPSVQSAKSLASDNKLWMVGKQEVMRLPSGLPGIRVESPLDVLMFVLCCTCNTIML
jgi:hypothetical protein